MSIRTLFSVHFYSPTSTFFLFSKWSLLLGYNAINTCYVWLNGTHKKTVCLENNVNLSAFRFKYIKKKIIFPTQSRTNTDLSLFENKNRRLMKRAYRFLFGWQKQTKKNYIYTILKRINEWESFDWCWTTANPVERQNHEPIFTTN